MAVVRSFSHLPFLPDLTSLSFPLLSQSYFQVAAKLGDPDAQQELAFCLLNGKGCKKDKKEAAKWYRAAVSFRVPFVVYHETSELMDGLEIRCLGRARG